jgi:site-specific recombinase XerD
LSIYATNFSLSSSGHIIGGEEPITLSVHRRMMERVGRTINLHGASPHIFRHSYATLLNDAGASIKIIQSIIGHSDVQTTINRYVHSRDEKKQEAVRSVNEMLIV